MHYSGFSSLLGGLMSAALLGCLAGLLIGAICWGIGVADPNTVLVERGKRGVLAALLAALLIGAAPHLVDFFTGVGERIITANVDRKTGRFGQARITLAVDAHCHCPAGRPQLGALIEADYTITNTGGRTIETIAVRAGDGARASCPAGPLAPGKRVTCTLDEHLITRADMHAGRYAVTATATASAADGTDLATDTTTSVVPLH